MEEIPSITALGGKISGITFSLATRKEILKSSISDCPISHASQLSNPFLGLPLETGKCESCGTAEPGQCEGHFGYIELPIPIYHPDHVCELRRMLSLLCLKCLKIKNRKFQVKNVGVLERMLSSCCEDASQVSVNEVKNADGAFYLELKVPSRTRLRENFWVFLEKYGFRYGDSYSRALLPSEVMAILRKIPEDTRKKLSSKGYFPQEGYILQYLPVPPNCLSVPDISDGMSIMSTDHSITLLKKVLKQIEVIKSSRSGMPNFESHHIEANDLQTAVAQYFEFRGTGKASRDVDTRFGVNKESNISSTKAWLEKMKTLFIRKGSGFSSRSVITGDPYKGVNEIGLPFEIAQRITFEERVNQHNMEYLQKLVDKKLCLTYRDGASTYSLREGSKGHTFLRPGQVVHRRIMDGDMVFINRPPTTHKHSLQALSVYIHDDHTVKINPLICGPLSADFDGDCIHLFYPQSLGARAEVLELFSVEKQLLSSHTGNFNLQLATDSLLSLKLMFKKYFYGRPTFEQLAMFVPNFLPRPAVIKGSSSSPLWTALQILQTALPPLFDCSGERYLTCSSEMVKFDFNRDVVQAVFIDIVTSILFSKGPKEVLRFFNSLIPLLMENLYLEGFSVCLEDFYIPKAALKDVQESIQSVAPLLHHMRSNQSESVQFQLENYLCGVKLPISNHVLKSSAMGNLIDSKSESAINKVVQQVGFLGIQVSDKGRFYSKTLVNDMSELFRIKYPSHGSYPSEEFGLVRSCLFYGLDPYQEMVHSIASREIIVRSSRGLTEPGTLFKNLMAILRDVVICYDSTVRNVCSNSIIQFEYGVNRGMLYNSEFGAGEPVGVLAATAMSNPAYKAVLDSSPSSNSSWDMMKEILLCGVNFKNDISDRRVILYLKDCCCGRKYCSENAAYVVKNQLSKISLKDAAVELLIEYKQQHSIFGRHETDAGLIGHIHLNEVLLRNSNISMNEILYKCEQKINYFRKRKKLGFVFKRVVLRESGYCTFKKSSERKLSGISCLRFVWQETVDDQLERITRILSGTICPVLLETIIKGDPRVSSVNIMWINPDTPTWIRSPCKSKKGELALDVVIEKDAVKRSGDAWRIVMDSCLPVIHLIDTRRSIPYAIKQVQELLGISCAFEQAVQRLSTSVMMVTKGVLKDHLVLLASSMTFAGNLIGFNMGGIKALSRSLNVQVPFTEATLSAPRKCFERAAEKRHVDNLSSVVASCSWGKRVAVGTGSSFDILVNTQKADLNQPDGIDVYDFLHLVTSSSIGEETSTACIGAEIDNLDLEDEYMGADLSPLRDSEKLTFEDGMEFDENSSELGWEGKSPLAAKSSGGWDQAIGKAQDISAYPRATDSVWNGSEIGKTGGFSKRVEEDSPGLCEWGAKEAQSSWKHAGSSFDEGRKVDSERDSNLNAKPSGAWEQAIDKAENVGGTKVSNSAWSSWDAGDASNNVKFSKNSQDDSPNYREWGAKENKSRGNQLRSSSAWGMKVHSDEDQNNVGEEGGFSQRMEDESPCLSDWGAKEPQGSWKRTESSSNWEKKVDSERDLNLHAKPSGERELEIDETESVALTKVSNSAWSSWGTGDVGNRQKFPRSSQDDSPNYHEWGSKENRSSGKQLGSSSAWNSKVHSDDDWNKEIQEGGFSKRLEKDSPSLSDWGAKEAQSSWKQAGSSSDWGKNFNSEGGSNVNARLSGAWEQAMGKVENVRATKVSNSAWSGWGTSEGGKEDIFSNTLQNKSSSHDWGAKEHQNSEKKLGSSSAWGKKVYSEKDWHKTDEQSSRARVATPKHSDWSKWGSDAVHEEDNLPTRVEEDDSKSGGDAATFEVEAKKKSAGTNSEDCQRDVRSQWGSWGRLSGKGDSNENSRIWNHSSNSEWKNRRNRPPRSAENFNNSGTFTKTRQRLDLFTVEEQDILSDVEPIMENIRRIMSQIGYNDGDPLSADDQSYIVDNVLNYHPDKAIKIGAGINYLMVSRHDSFLDSRCFYVVSTDGHKQDFSYRKCLENFIKGKYPDRAEAFTAKYFRKPQSRPGWSRDRVSAPDEAGTLQEQ